jgi:hypothetical protein
MWPSWNNYNEALIWLFWQKITTQSALQGIHTYWLSWLFLIGHAYKALPSTLVLVIGFLVHGCCHVHTYMFWLISCQFIFEILLRLEKCNRDGSVYESMWRPRISLFLRTFLVDKVSIGNMWIWNSRKRILLVVHGMLNFDVFLNFDGN